MVANIWTAASDGDIKTVESLILSGNFTANSKDENGYTPIHAAVSYNHLDLLDLLITKYDGDINIQDSEGDTPLHHVEELNTAKILVTKYQADYKIKNSDGLTAAQFIEEDDEFPEVVQYLRSLSHEGHHVLDSMPRPDEVTEHKIRYTYEKMNDEDIQIDIDDAQREVLKNIVEGENPEEALTEFIKGQVQKQYQEKSSRADDDSDDERRGKRRRD